MITARAQQAEDQTLEAQYRAEYWATGEWPEWCWHCGAEVAANQQYCPTCHESLLPWDAMCIVGIAGPD